MSTITESYIKENFGRIWPGHVAAFARYLILCRKSFRGDLDLLLLMAVVGDRTLSVSKVPKDLTYENLFDGPDLQLEPEAINYQSIADYTGLARESVRRKINELIEIGWIERTADGYLIATRQAAEDLAPLTEAGFTYLVQMAKVLRVKGT